MAIAGVLEIQMMMGLARLSDDMRRAERMVGDSMSKVERSVGNAKRVMQSLGAGLSIGLVADQVRRMTDQYTKLDAQLRIATTSQAAYARGMSDIRRISAISQSDINATSMLYTRLLNTTRGMRIEQEKIATVTETVSFGLKAYGATAAEASSATLQLSQAMGANRLGGEEFRAVMEAMPNVMQVVADSMGVPLGGLRQLSIEGKITADVLVKALGDPAIAAQFKMLAEQSQTVTGAWQVARNELMLLIGEFAKSSGTTNIFISSFNLMAGAFATLSQYMQQLIFIAGGYVAFLTTKWIVTTALAIEKTIAHSEALAMNAAVNVRAAQTEAALAAEKAGVASSTAATTVSMILNTKATVEATTATLAKAVADNTATIAQLNHARAVAQLSGHLHIIRQIEAELAVTTQALVVAETELSAATARQIRLEKILLTEDAAAIAARGALTRANVALAASEAAASAATVSRITAIGIALRTAIMAHPIIAATTAITAIVLAVANWDRIIKTSKSSFKWFMKDFIGGLQFGAEWAGIAIGELVSKIGLLATVTLPQIKSGEFKKQWDGLTALAEQSRIDAAARLAGIDKASQEKEKIARAMQLMQDREEWDKFHATKQQQRAAEIAELNAHYLKLASVQGRSQAEQIALAEEYRVKLADIDATYNKTAVTAAANAHIGKMQQALADAEAEFVAENNKLSRTQKLVLQWNALRAKEQTATELAALAQALIVSAKLDEADAQEALTTQMQSYMGTIGDTTAELIKKADAAEKEVEQIGLTEDQLLALTEARYNDAIAIAAVEHARLLGAGKSAEAFLIEQQIIALARSRDIAAIKTAKEAHKDLWASIDRTAHDTFVSILNGGKDVATRLKEAFKNGFFDWLYSMTLKKWIVNISGAFGGGGAVGMANAASGVNVGGGSSWLSSISGGFEAIGGTLGTSAAKLGAWAYEQGAQQVGMSIMKSAHTIGTAGAAIGGGLAGIGIGTMLAGDKQFAGMGGSTTSTIGAIAGGIIGSGIPVIGTAIGAAIGGALGGALNAAFGTGPRVSGTTTLAGRFSQGGFAGQYQTPWSEEGGWFSGGDAGTDITPVSTAQRAALSNLVSGSKFVFDQLIAASGEAEKSLAGWTFGINRQVASQAQQKQLTLDIATSMGNFLVPTLKQFKATGESLADTAVRMRDEFRLTDTIVNMIGKDTADAFGAVGLASMSARDNLIGLLGGITQADATMQSYYQNFFNETERNTNAIAALDAQFTALGLSLPDTREGYRALVEAQDLSTVSGRSMFASLINLNGAFAAAIPVTEDLSQRIADLSRQRIALEIELMEASGDVMGALAAKRREELAALDDSLRPLQSAIYAAEDRAKAERNAAEASARAADIARDAFDRLQNSIRSTSTDIFATAEAYDRFVGQGASGYMAPMIEIPTYQTPVARQESSRSTSELIEEVQQLRAEQQAGAISLASSMASMDAILRRWNGDGMPAVRTV